VKRRQRRQAGFTLTELMVVVTIIGVLVTMAIVYMRPRVRPLDAANRLGDLVREGSRRAVALGPVRADVVVALGSKARTQVLATTSGTVVTFTLYRLQEAALPTANGTWMPIESYAVDANVLAARWAPGVGDRTMAGQLTTWNTFVAQCKPDGTCDPVTVFFQASTTGPDCSTATTPVYEQCGKLSIMPLGGAITTRADWL
jgi:prepilin-type N-terminal cleavage/methylation domain-containing protein